MKRRIIYFTILLFTAGLFFSCSDMLSELNGKKKNSTTNGEPLSIELTAGKPQKNEDGGQKLTVTITVTTDSKVKKVVWKKSNTLVSAKALLKAFDDNEQDVNEAVPDPDNNKKWTFEITATNEIDGNVKYIAAVLDGAGRRESEEITLENNFDFTNPPVPENSDINADYPDSTNDTSIKLTWTEPDENAEPNYDHAEITLTYTQDDGNGGTKTSDPVTKTVNKGTTDYIFKQTDLPDDKKQEYTFTVKYVDTVGNESNTCEVKAKKYTLTYPTDETGTNTATKTVLVKDGEKLRADQLPVPDGDGTHEFDCWYDENGKLVDGNYIINGSIKLTPKWKPIVTYITTYGTAPEKVNVIGGTSLTAEQLPDLKDEKHSFGGWFDSNGTQAKAENYTVEGDITLTAKWTDKCVVSYSTTLGTAPKDIYVEEGGKLTEDQLKKPELNENEKKNEKYFWGWYTDKNYDDNSKVNTETKITENTPLYAKWEGRALTESVKVLKGNEKDGTAGTGWEYVLFGDWPQTIKAGEVEITTTTIEQGMFTYYLGKDNEWYVECEENARNSDYKYSDGTTVGRSGRKKWFKVEPIKWRVLTDKFDHDDNSETDKQWLLLAENILTGRVPYYVNGTKRTIKLQDNSTIEVFANNYQYSTVRAYLNGKYEDGDTQQQSYEGTGFLQSAFTEGAQSKIGETEVDNSAASTNPESNPEEWNNGNNQYASNTSTNDRIFLLSEKEVTTEDYGFGKYDSDGPGNTRIRMSTDYAMATKAGQLGGGYGGFWWLRSPSYLGRNGTNARFVSNAGDTSVTMSNSSDMIGGGIVPALSVSAPEQN